MVNQTEVTGQAVNSSIKYCILLREQDLTQTETFDFILLAWGGFKKQILYFARLLRYSLWLLIMLLLQLYLESCGH